MEASEPGEEVRRSAQHRHPSHGQSWKPQELAPIFDHILVVTHFRDFPDMLGCLSSIICLPLMGRLVGGAQSRESEGPRFLFCSL
jgi:hypothetical protein